MGIKRLVHLVAPLELSNTSCSLPQHMEQLLVLEHLHFFPEHSNDFSSKLA